MGRITQGELKPIPWDQLSEIEKHGFSMGGTIPIQEWFLDGTAAEKKNNFWSKDTVDHYIEMAKNKEYNYYGETDGFLYNCLDVFDIAGKSVAILGSIEPWYEAVCIARGATPTTIEYNKLETDDSRLNLMTVEEYNKSPRKFDAAISISSFEHDGLGRYGDPIDPEGDLKAMNNVRENILDKGGLLFLSVPVGFDKCVWNAHRIYGEKRLRLLSSGFNVVAMCPHLTSEEHRNAHEILHLAHLSPPEEALIFQPMIVLRNKG